MPKHIPLVFLLFQLTVLALPADQSAARIDGEPVDQSYGRREYGARDPEGHRWWFASPLKTAR